MKDMFFHFDIITGQIYIES